MTHQPYRTHEVSNQPPPLEDYNVFAADAVLVEGLKRWGGAWAESEISALGEDCGRASTILRGRQANDFDPALKLFDRFGHRIDEVEFHPAWHEIMASAVKHRMHSLPWVEKRAGAHVARAAGYICRHQVDEGTSCPITMTFAAPPALAADARIMAEWGPRLMSDRYDARGQPAAKKTGALMGMGMTEKQGGSDVRSNTTRATPIGKGGPGQPYEIVGHKWFFSAPMCDAFLILAYAPKGLSCFLLPRWTPEGERNAIRIQRLKGKLGNWSNASSEVEFHGAWAELLGEEGRGVATIIEMVRHTRLDCCLGSAATLRQAIAQATHHCSHRVAFQRRLVDQPLMQNVLADIALESEAASTLALWLAHLFDRAPAEPAAQRLSRLMTAVGKYWICKRAIHGVAEALECIGGNGYVEEGPMARLYRDVPLNSIWEGSGNVQCLDLLRALSKDPETLAAFYAELAEAEGRDGRFDAFVAGLKDEFKDFDDLEARSRALVERMGLAMQAALLLRHAPGFVAEAFVATRLAGGRGMEFGTMVSGLKTVQLIERARPKLAAD
jgi:putative acyl-CoA dehydrogenase